MHLLLVDPDADRLAQALGGLAGLDVTPVASVSAARAYLAGTSFGAVAMSARLDGSADLAALASRLGVVHGVLTYSATEAQNLSDVLGARLGISQASGPAATLESDEVRDTLVALRDEIGRVAHDLANPLAVVMGSAQLGAEMARALGADASLTQAFADVETGGRQLSDRIAQLGALRARLDRLIGPA